MEDNLFELTRNEADGKEGIFAISLVEEPAFEEDAVYFSKEEDSYYFQVDEERGLLTGPLMIPEKRIPRPSKGKTVFFSKEGIEEEIYNMSALPFTMNHEKEADGKTPKYVGGVKLAEKWVIEDKMDKAYARGFDPKKLPIGTGMITAKFFDLQNNVLWKKIKEGTIKGFSLEGKFQNESVEARKATSKALTTNLSKETHNNDLNAVEAILEDYANSKPNRK